MDLFEAIDTKCIETISKVLSEGVDVNSVNKQEHSKNSPLTYMIKKGLNANAVKKLVDFKANVNYKVPRGRRALHYTAQKNNSYTAEEKYSIIKILLDAGADVNSQDCSGWSTLHIALNPINFDLVELLLNYGADVNIQQKGRPPLQYLLDNLGQNYDLITEACIKKLINAGADVKTRNSGNSLTSLHYSVYFKSTELTLFLLNKGADVNAEAYCDRTPLHTAVSDKTKKQYKQGNIIELVQILLSHGANASARAGSGWSGFNRIVNMSSTPLHFLATVDTFLSLELINDILSSVKLLLKHGADLNALDDNNATPIMRAVGSLRKRTFQKHIIRCFLNGLFDLNPNVNVITTTGKNILNYTDSNAYGNENIEMSNCVNGVIIEHLAKLHARHQPLHSSLLETINEKQEFQKYFTECQKELESIKDNELESNSINFSNLLMDNKRKLSQYAGNKALVESFNAGKTVKKYRIYGNFIKKRFSKAIEKRKIRDQYAVALSSCLPGNFHPDHLLTRKILGYCKIKDLKKLIE